MATLADKEYEAKLQNLRRHAPFLKGMIDKLRTQERTQQVSKLESLWSMITSNKRLKFETLQKCEDVMLKIQSKSIAGVSKTCSHSDKLNIKSPKATKPDKNVAVIMNAVKLNIARAKLHNEVVTPTPKSPTPDRDLPQHIPITIPMDKIDIDEIASPDPDDDPTTWSETSENRYDSARPDVYKNAVMRKPEEKPPTPIIPSVNINTPPISMQDLQQLEDSIPVEKKQHTECKKELSAEEKFLKRRSKVSLVPAPIIKPKHKKGADKILDTKSKSDEKKKTDKEIKDASKPTSELSKCKDSKPKSEKEHRKSSESLSKNSLSSTKSSSSSSKTSNSHKSSHHISDKPISDIKSIKHLNHVHNSKDKDGKQKVKEKKSQHSKSPRNEASVEDQTSSNTIFGNLLTSIDNTLLTERDSAKDIVKKKHTTKTCKTSELDKSNKPPGATEITQKIEVEEKPTEEKAVFKRLADKYNPRPKKKEPEVEKPVESVIPSKPHAPLLPISTGPPCNLQHNIKFSPPPESQFIQHHQQFSVQQAPRRPNFNPYDINSQMEHQRSPMEYDLSKIGPADFYNNKSPPFNARQLPEPLMNRIIPHPEPFPSWNNRGAEGNDFQGRRLHQDHPRIDPRLSRQQSLVGDVPNNRFDNNFDRQVDGNRFFIPNDNTFDRPADANRFVRPDDNSFEANRFIRHDNNVVSLDRLDDGNRFCRPNDNFVRLEDTNFDCNRFVRPDDNVFDNARFVRPEDNVFEGNRFNLDRPRDGNRSFRPTDNNVDRQGNRFFRPNDTNLDRQIDGNRFVRPAIETREINRPFRPPDKPDNRFLRPDDKIVPRQHDDDDNSVMTLKDKPFSRKDDLKKVPKIEDAIRPDPRLQRPPKSEPLKSIKFEPPSTSTLPKREVYDEMYSRINIKVKDERESFTSPLDSIYEKKQQVSGKGYGVQNFRIPKKPRPPPVAKCPSPPRKLSPTPPRRRSLSPPLKRPPTPPRKRRSPSPPEERMPTPPPAPKIVDEENKTEDIPNVPEIVAQLPESLRKDDRFGDVVNVLSSLLRDETALTKIKRLLTKGAKNSSSDDDDNSDKDTKPVSKKTKSKKLVKRQPKKQPATKKPAAMKSPLINVDSTSTDTESMQVRRSGRLRKRIMVFDDYDSEDTTAEENTNNKEKKNTEQATTQSSISKEQQLPCEQPLTDEQLDDIVSCIDPFDDFLPDNEADQLVEEALKQPAEKLEEEINKQLVNNIFDSLKNEDNLDVPVEDTQKIIDSWGLSDANADKMIDSWNIAEVASGKSITENMFDKDEKDEDNSQDRQEDVRNEIDELIKNMPLNDSDKILDCDIVKENKMTPVTKDLIVKENDKDEITKCDDAISSITKKLTEENNKSISSMDDQCSETKPIKEDADKLKVFDEVTLSNKSLYGRPLRSSPRVRPPVSYTDDLKPRAKRGSKKLDAADNSSSNSPTKQESQTTPEKIPRDEIEAVRDEDTTIDNECFAEETKPEEKIDADQSKPDENTSEKIGTNNQTEILESKPAPSKAMIHLDLVITEMLAKYSADGYVTPSAASERVAKKSHKKSGSKPKRKVLPIQEDIKVEAAEIEEEGAAVIEKSVIETMEKETNHKPTNGKGAKNRASPENDVESEEVAYEIEQLERPISRNAKKQADVFEPSESIAEDNIAALEANEEETLTTISKKQNGKSLEISDSPIKDTCALEDTFSIPSTEHEMEKNNTDKGKQQNDVVIKKSEASNGTTSEFERAPVDKVSETSEGLTKEDLIEDTLPPAAESKVGKVQNSNQEISIFSPGSTENISTEDMSSIKDDSLASESTIEAKSTKVDGSKTLIETSSTDVVENLSEEIPATPNESPIVPKKKRVIVKRRGRPCKLHPLKKKPAPKPLVASTTTSETGSTIDLTSVPEEVVVRKAGRPRKFRSELDKLHEDIKETMGDKVLTSKRTSMKSPRGAEEVEEAAKVIEEDSEDSDESVKQTAPTVRQKAKGGKVVVEHLPINKTPAKSKKAKAKQTKKAAAKEPSEDEQSESDDNDSSTTVLPLASSRQTKKRKKRHNAWKSGVIRSKKRKTGKMADTTSDKTVDQQGDESDLSDDIDTDYDVEFVEPDAEHYMLKGKPTKCRLCDFEGLTLVDHYVNNHRAGEVPVSRMCPEDSKLALEDSKENNYYFDVIPQNLLMPGNRNKKIRFAFTCRFCLQDFPQFSNVQFTDHIATHTGEYRHKCSGCELKNASARFVKIHYTEVHETDEMNDSAPVEVIIKPPLNFHTVFGYMCSDCHFVQLSYRSVTEHIQIYHLDESAAAIKVNMSLPPGTAKKPNLPAAPAAPAPPVVEVSLDTGVFTTQEVVMEEELQREEEANRTELMKEIHKEVTASRLSSVAELLKTRFDSSPEIQQELPEQSSSVPKEVVRLPKAKPKEPPIDVKPCLEQLNQQIVLPKPLQSKLSKYTIFIIGPLKAVVSLANQSVDFACITDDCVYYTTDREGMAQHCRTVHDNRCERIRCGYCVFMGNAVPLVEVFDHICAKHVDPLLVKEEPEEREKKVVAARKVTVPKPTKVKVKEVHSSPSPPRLPFMGNHFGIKIVHVAGGVTDDIIPLEDNTPQPTPKTDEGQREEEEELDEVTGLISTVPVAPLVQQHQQEVNAQEESISQLPQLLPISQQSPSVLKKLSSLQRQLIKQSDLTVSNSGDGIIVSKVETKSRTSSPISTNRSNKFPLLMDVAMELTPNTSTSIVAFEGHSTTKTMLLIDDNEQPPSPLPDKQEDISDAQQVLITLTKVSALPKDSAIAMKRRFHTGKTDLLYRCPDSKCGFASETRIDFLLHLRSIAGKHTDLQKAYRCVYCYTTLPLEHYSSHLFYYHGTSEFGCSRCCYRGITPYHINLHKNNCHLYDQTDVVLLPLASDVPTSKVEQAMNEYWPTKLKSLLNPYSCYCGERYIVTANYSAHLERTHRGDLTRKGIDCRDCTMKGVKNMIAHYAQVHNNHLYHCIYCTFGGDTSAVDVFSHQSARHPGLPMEVIVRTIPTDAPSLNYMANAKKSPMEDDSVWSKLVRLPNPQAAKDSDTIKLLRETQSTAINNSSQQQVASTVQTTSTTPPPVLSSSVTHTLPPQQTESINPVPVTSPQDVPETPLTANSSKNTIEIIDLIALSPDPAPIEIQPSEETNVEAEQSPKQNLNQSGDTATIKIKPISRAPTPIEPINQSKVQSLTINTSLSSPSRCVTPTNQPIPSPSVSSIITTPDEDIFVVVQSSSEVPLAGSDLFVCAQCGIHCTTSGVFRAHIHDCVKVDREANTKPYACAHCERRSKTSTALLDHMRVHGFPRYRCGLCDFKHTQPWNIRTHMRSEHNISTCVQVAAHPNKLDDDFDDFIYRPRQSQLAPSAHQIITQQSTAQTPTSTLISHNQTQASKEPSASLKAGGAGKDRKLSTSSSTDGDSSVGADGFAVPMQKFLPTEVDKLPMRAVYTSEVGCGLCGYKSKVRTNIVRHLKLHVDGLAPTDLPTSACVNPVPCLERDELMFDKMTNLAYNSHQADLSSRTTVGGGRMGGSLKVEPVITAEKKETAEEAVTVGPQYVPCSNRYVCGAVDCNYLCHDEIVFRRHIQALHSHSEVSYRCRHCPPAMTSATPAMMNVELVLRHLRLHGAALYKCAHCPFLHNMRSIIDRHITERHLEKNVPNQLKAIITVRDLMEDKDEDNSTSSNTNSSAAASNNSAVGSGSASGSEQGALVAYSKPTAISSKDAKPWRCAMCKVRCVTVEDIVNHTTNKHKIGSRYKCGYCDYSNDDRESYFPHFAEHHPDSPTPDIIIIYFHDPATIAAAGTVTATTSSDQQDPAAQQQLFSNESDHDFDTTPLWRKPTTGDVRHIRGILLETRGQHMQHRKIEQQGSGGKRDRWSAAAAGEAEVAAKSCESTDYFSSLPPKKQAKLSAASRVAGKRAAKSESAPPTLTSQLELFPASSLVISVPVDDDIRYYCDVRSNLRLVDVNNLSVKKLLIAGNLHGRYGEYGRPTETGYRCPKCVIFETNGERQLLNHLHKEIDYKRYVCERCQTRSTLSQSIYMRCPAAPVSANRPHSDCVIYSRVDVAKEQWALMVLAIQTRIAAHLTANKLWAQAQTLGGDMGEQGMGASAVMKGLKLAYGIKGNFRPTEIFPKSAQNRITVAHKPPPKNIQDQYHLSKKKIASSRYPLRNTNTTMQSTTATEKEGTVRCKTKIVNQMSTKLSNIFAQVQNSKQTTPALMPKKLKRQDDVKGIQMFPNVPEVVTIEAGSLGRGWERKGAASDDDDDNDDDDDDDDDEVEIIDPLVDIVDVDAEADDDCQEVIDTAAASAPSSAKKVTTEPIPGENVTVSSFLPTIGDTDPLAAMDDTTYSDNDSVGGLEIAEDEEIDEEIEPVHLQFSPSRNLNTSIKTISAAETTPELTITSIKTAAVDTTTCLDEQVVSSTTSDQQVNIQVEQGDKQGIIATLTPIDASLVGRLRVIGDASMVGCFGLSSGLSVQLTASPQQQLGRQVMADKVVAGVRTMHKCPHCNYCSANAQSVKKHEVRHWAEKPHHCGYVYPTGLQCDFQHHYRANIAKHILDAHPRVPGQQQIPIIHVKITNPTIIGLRRARSSTAITDLADPNAASTADGDNPTAKRMRFAGNVDGDDGGTGATGEEDFVERYTCPTCTYTSHKIRYVQQHLRLHVKCIKCQLCNEKDTQKKRLTEEKCPRFHENIPSRLVIEYDSYELDRLKNLIQKIRVPKSSLQTLDQAQIADDDDDNEFLEVFKTVRNYPTKQQRFAAKQQQSNLNNMMATQQQQQQQLILPLSQCLTTFDVATSSYVPMQQTSVSDVVNTLYRVDSAVTTAAASLNDSADKESGVRLNQPPILLNSFLGQPRISSTSQQQQQQPTARKSTGGCSILRPNLTLNPHYAPANFYTSPPQNAEQDQNVSIFRTDTIH